MIQWMHALSKSWVATLLMGGLTLSFVVWGIADVFTGGSTAAVASVGGTDIGTQEFQRSYKNFLRNQGQQMGMDITPDMAQKMGLAQVALQQMVGRTALDNEAGRLGLTTSDAAVAQNVRAMSPFRGALGTFDRPTFVQAINNAGYHRGAVPGRSAPGDDARPALPGGGRQFRGARRPMPRRCSPISTKSAPPIMWC